MTIVRSGRVLPAVIAASLLIAVTAATLYLVFMAGPGGAETRLEKEIEAGVRNGESGEAATSATGAATGTMPGIFMTIKAPQVEHWKDDRVQWKLDADEVESHTGTGMTEFRGARGEFFREERLVLEFRSPFATFDEKERRATAGGGIEGRLINEGYTIRAGRLEWVERDNVLTLEDGVGLDFGGGNRIEAGRVEVTDEMKKFRFTNGVEIELTVKQ